jgi:hypothetical protein
MAMRLLALILLALPLPAEAFERVADPQTFAQRIVGRTLSRAGIRLTVLPDGRIEGRALGWSVTGDWHWVEDYFCRTMDWSGYEIAYNCMVVLANDRSVRFIADRGTGDYADFRIR